MKQFITLFLITMAMVSCLEDPKTSSWEMSLVVEPDSVATLDLMDGAKVSVFNQQKGISVEGILDNTGRIVFKEIESGFYTVSVTHSFNLNDVYYSYNGYHEVKVFTSLEDTVQLFGSSSSTFVIKEVYYSGSLTPAGKAYLSDQFIEIYNNTASVQYAGGLSIVEHESYASDENVWKDIKDTIVVKAIWSIPGTAWEVPVNPGEGIVIAQDAIDHKDDSLGNADCPVNLGIANYEFFVEWETHKDIDAPAVANMKEDLFVYRGKDYVMHIRGGSAMALVRLPGKDRDERLDYINAHLVSKSTASGSNSSYFNKIATAYVIDAVEITWDEAHALYKRFPPFIDAGYTYIPSGSKSGKSVRRKVEKTVDGRVVYKDTNNSSEDFDKDMDPQPGIY